MIWLWHRAERPQLPAAVPPRVSLTVIHVQAGAYLNVGGVLFGPRTTPAPPERNAITTEGDQK